ncbi:MAG: hypothetical protein LUF04_02470, partial [Bacteroides sp.]|nr:hypothetical protein [Bacteroides sp.]
IGLSACSNKDDLGSSVPEGITTYVNLSIKLPGNNMTRALPEDYNPDGEYEGNDGVETLDIYMRSGDGTIEAKRFTGSGISSTGSVISLPASLFAPHPGSKRSM